MSFPNQIKHVNKHNWIIIKVMKFRIFPDVRASQIGHTYFIAFVSIHRLAACLLVYMYRHISSLPNLLLLRCCRTQNKNAGNGCTLRNFDPRLSSFSHHLLLPHGATFSENIIKKSSSRILKCVCVCACGYVCV